MCLAVTVAPFQVHIVLLAKGEGEAQGVAEKLYGELTGRGLDVLLDDRKDNPGVKFKDADLIGIPVRVTVGDRGLKNEIVEFKLRREEQRLEIPVEDAFEHVVAAVEGLYNELEERVVEVEYEK